MILTIFEYGKNVIFVRIKLRAEKTDEARKIISPVGQTPNRVRDKKLLSQIHLYIHTCIADIKINKYVCACVCVCEVSIPAPKGGMKKCFHAVYKNCAIYI